MASQALIKQSVIFISATGEFDETGLFANSLIQSLAANSAGTALSSSLHQYRTWDGTNWTQNLYYEITCFVPVSFQATIQANIQALQTAFPQYTIITYGDSISWGH